MSFLVQSPGGPGSKFSVAWSELPAATTGPPSTLGGKAPPPGV